MRLAWIAVLMVVAACGRGVEVPLPPRPTPLPVAAAGWSELEAEIRARIAAADSAEVSVSIIDLASWHELHINGDVVMHAASTMKVPVLLEIFRRIDEGTLALDSTLLLRNEFKSIADTSHYALDPGDDSDLELYQQVGRPVTIGELTRRMITRSSNLATNNLIDFVTPMRVRTTVAEAGGTGMTVMRGVEDGPAFRKGLNNTTTSRGLAHVLAAIASCKSHTRNSCDQMLGILAAQEFNEMIPGGLPAGTRVAHKTGWITGIRHDGAIVLPGQRAPYVLVILIRGITDTRTADRLGADISRMVWQRLTDPQWQLPRSVGSAARALSELHEKYRVHQLATRRFTHANYWAVVQPYTADAVQREEIGKSAEGRPLYALKFGAGPTRVLLWSQMHGNESTATLALADLIRYMHEGGNAQTAAWAKQLTVLMIPMLNPDGAEWFQRRNALGIDINRDARVLSTPEARALKNYRDRHQPQFGFNLHDQSVRTRIERSGRLAAIALLAPAYDASRSDNAVRTRAKHVASVVRDAVESFVPGHVAKYDDGFNPRAFGDLMQSWGTSTVLIESGGWETDPEKQYLRKTNFAALVTALDALASGAYAKSDVNRYEALPENGPQANDLVIRGGTIVVPGFEPYRADIAVDVGERDDFTSPRGVLEIGDLAETVARDTLDATGLFVHPSPDALRGRGRRDERARLTTGSASVFSIRRGAHPQSEPVWIVEGGVVQPVKREDAYPEGSPHAAVGCYDVEMGGWSTPNADTRYLAPLAKLQLFWIKSVDMRDRGRLVARPVGDAKLAPFRHVTWNVIDADSITVTLSTGFAGPTMRLAREGDAWVGTARLQTDVVYPGKVDPVASVRFRRIACDTSTP